MVLFSIARFNSNNSLKYFEIAPKSFFYDFTLIPNTDGSKFIDFSPVNNTRREFPAPLPSNAFPFQIACAINYRDVYLGNNTARVYYKNESIAIFRYG